jgi:ABC-type siderophore export system fused ATPase/permease subunit
MNRAKAIKTWFSHPWVILGLIFQQTAILIFCTCQYWPTLSTPTWLAIMLLIVGQMCYFVALWQKYQREKEK